MEKHEHPARRRWLPPARWWVSALMLAAVFLSLRFLQDRPAVSPAVPSPAQAPAPAPKPALPDRPLPPDDQGGPSAHVPPPSEPTPPKADPSPPPSGTAARTVVRGDTACKRIALTYDAGAGAEGAAGILDALKKHHVKATFFLTGKWVELFPDLAKRIAAEGHEIANHTYNHPDLTKLSRAEVLDQVRRGEASIQKITGVETKPLFRVPYGAYNQAVLNDVGEAGFRYSIYWTLDTLDWQQPPVETIRERLLTKAANGSIVLMHLGGLNTAAATDLAIPDLRAKGFELTTVTGAMTCAPTPR